MKSLKNLKYEDLEVMSYSDIAELILKENGKEKSTADLFREICEENGMTCTDDNMDELDAAIDNGFFIFSDGTTITINEITLKY